MPTITISGQSYEVAALTEEDHASYRAYCLLLSSRADNPLERFFDRNQNLTLASGKLPCGSSAACRIGSIRPRSLFLLGTAPQGRRRPCPSRLTAGKDRGQVEKLIGPDAAAVYASLVSVLRAIVAPTAPAGPHPSGNTLLGLYRFRTLAIA